MSDVVVVGAGIVGAACAYYASQAGLSVTVLDRGTVGGGTTSRGEGNILVSDKGPGPELDLALRSRTLWLDIGAQLGADTIELEEKGGLVVAKDPEGFAALQRFAGYQRESGVSTVPLTGPGLLDREPHLAKDLAGGVFYEDDMQVQPMLAAAILLAQARALGVMVESGVTATGLERDSRGRVTAVVANRRRFPTKAVVNAAGTWSGDVAQLFGTTVPVLPRRGFVLVTEPLPRMVRHKVYSADYVSNVASSDAGLETSAVIEGTHGGTVLIGASRERVGYSNDMPVEVIRRLAVQAIGLFPFLEQVALMRVYSGFRPYCPDHLPVIGPDPRVQGIYHACGHEGAGIGLAPITGLLIAQLLSGQSPVLDVSPYSPARFDSVTA